MDFGLGNVIYVKTEKGSKFLIRRAIFFAQKEDTDRRFWSAIRIGHFTL
jgi:hypothetical protein